ncbi:unnamed protein product [Allacma fusca]|uniref:Uncharacterized protein n=1 Tax=Allacma fusca TaxID=39272 RepID=A0A8J2JTY0_9HEXA|nr:unnamed protein product [Allacma fusca]
MRLQEVQKLNEKIDKVHIYNLLGFSKEICSAVLAPQTTPEITHFNKNCKRSRESQGDYCKTNSKSGKVNLFHKGIKSEQRSLKAKSRN